MVDAATIAFARIADYALSAPAWPTRSREVELPLPSIEPIPGADAFEELQCIGATPDEGRVA